MDTQDKGVPVRKLKIGFSRGDSVVSTAICFLDKSDFSHTYLSFRSQTLDRDIIYQANFLGVNFINRENFLLHSRVIHEVELEVGDELHRRAMQFCVDKSGARYDFKGLLGKALVRLGLRKTNPWDDGLVSVDCTELVEAILVESGMDVPLDPSVSGPKALYEYLRNEW